MKKDFYEAVNGGIRIIRDVHFEDIAYLPKNVIIGRNVTIGKNVKIYKNVIIYNDVRIYDRVIIRDDVRIGENAEIGENSLIGDNVYIGPRVIIDKNSFINSNVPDNTTLQPNDTYICSKEESGYSAKSTDKINPEHYKKYPFETIDIISIIIDKITETEELTNEQIYCLGNALKYRFRMGYKDDTQTDFEKEQWYLERYNRGGVILWAKLN